MILIPTIDFQSLIPLSNVRNLKTGPSETLPAIDNDGNSPILFMHPTLFPGVPMKRLLLILFLVPRALSAQTEWSRHTGSLTIGLEGIFPAFKQMAYVDIGGFAILAHARFPVRGATIVLELPVVSSTLDYNYSFRTSTESKAAIGNMFLGIDFAGSSIVSGDLGIRLPLMSKLGLEAASPAAIADFLRLERYLAKAFTVEGAVKADPQVGEIVRLHLSVGPVAWIPIPAEGRDIEALLDYEGGASVQVGTVSFAAGITGRYIMTEEYLLPGKKTAHALQFEISSTVGPLHPSLYYRAFLDTEYISDALSSVIGVVVQAEL